MSAQQSPRTAYAYGVATVDLETGETLDTWYPEPMLGELPVTVDRALVPLFIENALGESPELGTRRESRLTEIDLDAAPVSIEDAYLRLHCLSTLLVRPNKLSLDGIFGFLPTVVFTSRGPISPSFHRANLGALRTLGVTARVIDKFPCMTDYVAPAPGVRIADTSRVRLGAHLSPGTTVMHEGFVNFNAGTLGRAMVEGRISQGVVVGDDSDIGGGASIMGTLSGGGTERVRIGERVLIGANAGTGISLSDDTVVEAGLYLTAATKVRLGEAVVKAAELSGRGGLTYRRNSRTGEVEALERSGVGVELNEALHA